MNYLRPAPPAYVYIEATGLKVHRYQSGPLGGDQQIGAAVSENKMDLVIFLRDPLAAMPHEPDVNALIRLCDVYNVPLATNIGTAEVLVRGLDAGFIDWRAQYEQGQLNKDILANLERGQAIK